MIDIDAIPYYCQEDEPTGEDKPKEPIEEDDDEGDEADEDEEVI